jgi:hypothetical protein
MGRRGRARERAAGARGTPPRGLPGRRLLRWLNPVKPRSRARARFASLAFGVLALTLAAAALSNDRPALFRPAVLLGILTVLWAVRAATMPEDPEP